MTPFIAFGGERADRMQRGRIQIGLARNRRKVSSHRCGEDTWTRRLFQQPGGVRLQADRRGDRSGRGEEFATIHDQLLRGFYAGLISVFEKSLPKNSNESPATAAVA